METNRSKLGIEISLNIFLYTTDNMPGQTLDYQLAEIRPEDFVPIPGLDLAIAKDRARRVDGELLGGTTWYETKMIIQGLGSD